MDRIQNAFDTRLESLRGWAALSVLVAHALGILRVDGQVAYWMRPLEEQHSTGLFLMFLGGIFNPGVAVALFFVLSGYVLALSLRRDRRSGWQYAYIVRRVCRLLPAMWVSVGVMWVSLNVAHNLDSWEPFSAFFVNVFARSVDARDVLANATLLDHKVNPVTWTMAVEVVGSIFVPLSVLLSARYGRWSAWGLLFVTVIMTAITPPSNYAVHYLMGFQAGVMLACRQGSRVGTFKFLAPVILLGAGVVVMVVSGVVVAGITPGLRTFLNTGIAVVILGAVLLGGADRLLQPDSIRFLGRISYSLYLFHLPVLFGIGQLLVAIGANGPGLGPPLLMALGGLLVSIPVASLGFFFIERPAIAGGRCLALRLQGISSAIRSASPQVPHDH